MAIIPQLTLEERINDSIESQYVKEWPRSYIGYSSLGGVCERAIWYEFRWTKMRTTSIRMKRLFARGDWEEHRIIQSLDSIGIKHHSDQLEIIGLAGHIKGHIDGILEEVPTITRPVLGEFKTANEKGFNKFVKVKCEAANIGYFNQSQSYMGKLNLKEALFIVTNKNDERRYIELIPFNKERFDYLEARAVNILTSDYPPPRIGNGSPTWFECKFCNKRSICYYSKPVMKNCRTCEFGTIEEAGVWTCGNPQHIMELSIDQQKAGCEDYQILEGLKV